MTMLRRCSYVTCKTPPTTRITYDDGTLEDLCDQHRDAVLALLAQGFPPHVEFHVVELTDTDEDPQT